MERLKTRKPPTTSNNDSVPRTSYTTWKKGLDEVAGAIQIPFAALATKDQIQTQDANAISPYALDIVAIETHKEPIIESVIDLATNYPVLATVLDKISQSTPFAALAASVMTLGAQIAENHGVLPETMRGIAPGIQPREELANRLAQDAEDLQQRIQNEQNNSTSFFFNQDVTEPRPAPKPA